ncbi:MAG TPA: Hpt domain-containing protein [Pseudolabrys sp.]|jgi:HPt (histidine-containing phosphotransfer) domain-containing protein
MAQLATTIVDQEAAAAIDRCQLTRMTFGDRSLEREVLQLFDRQATILIERMRSGDPAAIGSLAHTLKGSAAGIGAQRVARAAEETEFSAGASAAECSRALDRLAQAADEARALIAELLREH